jgi:hypothetical protein
VFSQRTHNTSWYGAIVPLQEVKVKKKVMTMVVVNKGF